MNWKEPTEHPLWKSFDEWRTLDHEVRRAIEMNNGLTRLFWEAFVAGAAWVYYLPGG